MSYFETRTFGGMYRAFSLCVQADTMRIVERYIREGAPDQVIRNQAHHGTLSFEVLKKLS